MTLTELDNAAKQYVETGGPGCPCCGCWNIEGKAPDFDEGQITQAMSCTECKASWTDTYQLRGMTFTTDGQGIPRNNSYLEPSR